MMFLFLVILFFIWVFWIFLVGVDCLKVDDLELKVNCSIIFFIVYVLRLCSLIFFKV